MRINNNNFIDLPHQSFIGKRFKKLNEEGLLMDFVIGKFLIITKKITND